MDRLGGEGTGQISSIRQVALASFIGTAIEWYDFFLYGTAAALVFGQLFFPEATPLGGTLPLNRVASTRRNGPIASHWR